MLEEMITPAESNCAECDPPPARFERPHSWRTWTVVIIGLGVLAVFCHGRRNNEDLELRAAPGAEAAKSVERELPPASPIGQALAQAEGSRGFVPFASYGNHRRC